MDSALDDDEVELAADVVFVLLHVLSHGDGLLHEHVEVLRDRRGASVLLEDSENLLSGDESDLRNTVVISEEDTDLRWGHTYSVNRRIPFLDCLTIKSVMAVGVIVAQLGALLLNGRALAEIPVPCILPMAILGL